MERLFKTTKEVFLVQQNNIFSSALVISFMIVISRVFGFVRYRILAGYFSKEELDIYFAAFRIPDLIFEVLITGALISSFIPIYVKYQKNKEDLTINVSSIINILTLIMGVSIIALAVFIYPIVSLITPGFDPKKTEYIALFSRLLLLGQLPFLVIGNFLTGISQANKRFFLPALAPVVYNLAIIASTIVLFPTYGLFSPIIGVVIGSVLFLVAQFPVIKVVEFSYKPVIKLTAGVIEFFKVIVPRTVTIVVAQIDATIDLTLTTLLGAGSYTIFYLAQHLQLLPVSVIGIAFGQASLPYLSELYSENKKEEFKSIIVQSILNLFFLTFPIASFFIFARTPLVRLFFGAQKFDWEATVMTAYALSFFALSMPFHTIYYLLTRCFYAVLDSKTPFFVSVISTLINTVLSLSFILFFHLPVWSLALSFSIAMILNVVLLLVLLYKKLEGINLYFLCKESTKMMLTTVMASVPIYYLIRFLDVLVFDTVRTINVFFLMLVSGMLYSFLYFFLSWVFNIKEIYILSRLIFKAKEYRKKILEFYADYE